MDSKPHVFLSTTRVTPSSSVTPQATGSLLIRAPLTIDSDSDSDSDSDFESNGVKTVSAGNSSVNVSDSGFESDEGFASGEEFESASDRPFVADPEVENLEENVIDERYKISRPFVADFGDDVSENSTVYEEDSGAFAVMDNPDSKRVMPIAQLSVDDDEFDGLLANEELASEVEDDGYSGVVKIPDTVDSAPIKVALESEGGGGEEVSLDFRDSAILNQYEPYPPSTGEIQIGVWKDGVIEKKGPSHEPNNHLDSWIGSEDVTEATSKLEEDIRHSFERGSEIECLEVKGIESDCVVGHKVEEESASVGNGSYNNASEPKGSPVSTDFGELNVEGVVMQVGEPDFQSDGCSTAGSESTDDGLHENKIKGERALLSNEDVEELIFGSSATTQLIMKDLEQRLTLSSLLKMDSQDRSDTVDGDIIMQSDEVDVDRGEKRKEHLNSVALAAILKGATTVESDVGDLPISAADGSKVLTHEHLSHSDASFRSSGVAAPNDNINDEEKKRLEKIQFIRVKFLRLIQRLGCSPNDSIVAQVLYRLALALRSHSNQEFSLESARQAALRLEAEGKDDLDFSLNILVLGKTGVGKSATINSIFCEEKARIDAFEPATTSVKEIVGTINGVKIRILDTPGLRSTAVDEATNRKILASIKRFTKKFPPDVVLYIDRLDTDARNLTDLLLLNLLTNSLGPSIWQNAIVTLTHAACAPPDGPSGLPLSYDVFVAEKSLMVQRDISKAVGDIRLMNPIMMHQVSLVDNHPSCPKNGNGESILPNGQIWRPRLLLMCYSLKILYETNSMLKSQDPFDHRKLFGFRLRSLPVPYFLSSLLQSRAHPKLSADQGGDDDFDLELSDSLDSDQEEEDEYDQLPPFKPLKRSQIARLTKAQRKAYFEEYDYRVKLLQKKQWREELKRLRESKKRGNDGKDNYGHTEEDGDPEDGGPATVSVPLPDMVLPSSFDGDNPTYRYRFLDSTSQLLVRPVLDTQGWDHEIGYDGVSVERNLTVSNCFPGVFAVQITKDRKEFNIHLDSSICAKHGENGSTMAVLDIQTVGRQLAYILGGETKFKILKMNKIAAGLSVVLVGENVATGLKIEDQIAVGKRLVLVGSIGSMRCQGDSAYGAKLEVRLKNKDFPVEQDQTTLGLSLMNWKGDLAVVANLQSLFSIGRSSKMAVRMGLNNKHSGQITLKVISSENLQIALSAILPVAISIFRSICLGSTAKSSAY